MAFISFEGGDGSGKSTQVELLARALRGRGQQVVTTREPGGTELGGKIRDLLLHGDHMDPRTEAMLFAADRADHVARVIGPAMTAGATVITDRYLDSSIAYQSAGRGLDRAEVTALSMFATGGLIPQVTFLLDIDPALGAGRRTGTPDRLESGGYEFESRIREAFRQLAADNRDRFVVIDATQPREAIATRVLNELDFRGVV